MSEILTAADRLRCWAQRTGLDFVQFYVDVLVGRERTVMLERFLGACSLFSGLWVLSPWWESFGAATALAHVPEIVTAGLLIAQGGARLHALREPLNLTACIWAARIGTALWAAITISFLITPPRTLFIVPLVASLTGANFWITIRFHLLYPGR